jgi:HSP20 family protein
MSTITRYDPFANVVDDLFQGFFVRPYGYEPREAAVAPRMRVDVAEKNGAYLVTAEIPGVKKDDIQVNVDGAQVTLSAEVKQEREAGKDERVLHVERSYGKATRSFTLPQELDEAKVEARYRDGVLELTLPKKAAAARKQITVQ